MPERFKFGLIFVAIAGAIALVAGERPVPAFGGAAVLLLLMVAVCYGAGLLGRRNS